ncbi:hypothetical protein T492DRAFT_259346 [Pavlovales sp. CCMP2436]|nr:hypothetical protein T492DRAFT_259346 [Pavlovales sp. CCMP2436]
MLKLLFSSRLAVALAWHSYYMHSDINHRQRRNQNCAPHMSGSTVHLSNLMAHFFMWCINEYNVPIMSLVCGIIIISFIRLVCGIIMDIYTHRDTRGHIGQMGAACVHCVICHGVAVV